MIRKSSMVITASTALGLRAAATPEPTGQTVRLSCTTGSVASSSGGCRAGQTYPPADDAIRAVASSTAHPLSERLSVLLE